MEVKLLLILLSATALFSGIKCEVDVELKQGIVRGYELISHQNRTFIGFEGIPFAKPPVGNLRFEPPQPAEKWDGILEANKHYTCAQLLPIPYIWGPTGTEDCLYLYVYVPGTKIDKAANLPVVVHIHGGAFMLGSPRMMANPDLIIDKDVVAVTLNYRLGILGFLSTDDEIVPGNNGLKDQSMALKWIKENIQEFGGNPDSITITGLSAGGASVHYHYLSPMSKGLFSRGLSQSGTALQSWALTKNPLKKAQFVAKNVSCEIEDTRKMVECLRNKPHKDLIIGIDGLFTLISAMPPTPFGPVIERGGDNPFLNDHPYKLLKEGKVYDVPWINSNVKDEGIFPVGFYLHYDKIGYIAEHWDDVIPVSLGMKETVDESLKPEIAEKLKNFYYGDEPITNDNADKMIKMHNDRYFFIDSELATRTQAKVTKSPVYSYFFKFQSELSFPLKHLKPGVPHGFDGKLIFSWMILTNLKEKDEKMMLVMTDFMKKYAETGVPEMGGVKWDAINPDEDQLNVLEINDSDDIKMIKIKELGPTEFWNNLPIKENNHIY